jgi:hypothetical protein
MNIFLTLSHTQKELCLKRKVAYVAEIERGEQLTANPFKFNESAQTPSVLSPEPPVQRLRCDGGAKVQLFALKFKRGSYAHLLNCNFELENGFLICADHFRTHADRVVFSTSSLIGCMEALWRSYVTTPIILLKLAIILFELSGTESSTVVIIAL